MTTVVIYRRYLAVDPSLTERFVSFLLHGKPGPDVDEVESDEESAKPKTQFSLLRSRGPAHEVEPRPLEAAKFLLSLARRAARGEYTSPEGKSPYQLLGEWLDVCERFADDVGSEPEVADAQRVIKEVGHHPEGPNHATSAPGGPLIRFVGDSTSADSGARPYDKDEDPSNLSLLDVEMIVKEDGLAIYKDQAGRLWSGLATYWTKRGEFNRVRFNRDFFRAVLNKSSLLKAQVTFEEGIATVLTIRDFTQIFDAYAEFLESVISALMDSLASPDVDEDEADVAEIERELDERMRMLEELMDRRPFLINDVLLRRNPNDVQEWEKRAALWADNDDKVWFLSLVRGLLLNCPN